MVKNEDSKIEITQLMSAVNQKNVKWWDKLNSAQQRAFGAWLYNRYLSSSNSNNPDLVRYYLLAANRHINTNFTIINRHPKLAYLLFTTLPFQGGESFHPFTAPMKRSKSEGTALLRTLMKLYPCEKTEDLELMMTLMSDDDMTDLLESHGMSDAAIKQARS